MKTNFRNNQGDKMFLKEQVEKCLEKCSSNRRILLRTTTRDLNSYDIWIHANDQTLDVSRFLANLPKIITFFCDKRCFNISRTTDELIANYNRKHTLTKTYNAIATDSNQDEHYKNLNALL